MKPKYSRRQVTMAVVRMIEAGIPIKRIAQILAAYLIQSKQTRNVELYLRDIELAVSECFGITTVHVASVRKLNQATRKRIKQLVSSFSDAKKIEMIETIDPELIGGVVVSTADSEMDGSVRAKIRNLRSV